MLITKTKQSHFPNENYSKNKNNRIILNLRGVKYEVLLKNLSAAPLSSRLAKLKIFIENSENSKEISSICDDFVLSENEFFFDRDPDVFKLVLNYLVSGEFHFNENFCANLFSNELVYWGISEFEICECCRSIYWKKMNSIQEEVEKEKQIIEDYIRKDDFGSFLPEVREKIWKILTYSEVSFISKVN